MSHDGLIKDGMGVKVSLLAEGQEREWDAFVRAMPDATFCHLAGWKAVIESVFGHRAYYLLARRGDVVVGVLPLTHIRSRLFGNSLTSTAFCVYGGPVAVDLEARSALEVRAADIGEEVRAEYIEFRSQEPSHPDWLQKRNVYATFRKPIDSSVDANLKAIPRKQRAMVRKGMASGLRSAIDPDVGRLHRIYAESVRNLGTPVFPKSLFRALKSQFGDACDIITVERDGEAIASVMNFYFRDQVLPYYGGGTQAARAVAGNDFMYWEVMRRACERGYRVFDFGRSKVGTGAYDFKRYWGFAPTPLVYEYKLGTAKSLPDKSPLNPKYRLFIELWKRLPLPLANLIGPYIVRGTG
jgi:FemAB-related protein (PEP-CTERM system-associated)